MTARPLSRQLSALSAIRATAAYFFVALVFTWPLVLGLARDVPWDLGDSVLNLWILGWDADHLLRFLKGDFEALIGFWNANIFFPEPLTLAYSEHLFAQAVQILPVYALTGNLILGYNLLFLSTFVLSGLGMFLFVREITGNARAGFVAGLIYAFAPLRVPQFAHLQVISSHWMPFVLYGLRRYLDTRRLKPLAGACASLIAQNLSCGYFLLFFAPFVVLYVLFEMWTRRLLLNLKVWGSLAATAAIVAAATLPFLTPYLELRRLGFPPRALAEVQTYSADVYSYLTAAPELYLWGSLARVFPKPEGDLFPGLILAGLAAFSSAMTCRSAWRDAAERPLAARPGFLPLVYVLLAGCAVYGFFVAAILFARGFSQIGPLPIAVRSLGRTSLTLLAAMAVSLTVSPRLRTFAAESLRSLNAVAVLMALAAIVMSFGPEVHSMGRELRGTGPYYWFYFNVPGYDGLRVPARFAMLATLFLSAAAGFGVVSLEQRFRRGAAIAWIVGGLAVAEAFAAPIIINGTAKVEPGYANPPGRLYTGDEIPQVYKFLQTLPTEAVVIEFPIGEWAYELNYMYYSTHHWHPLLNGYSGTFPLSYTLRTATLRRPDESPETAWQTLSTSMATHAVVHENFFEGTRGRAVSDWLAQHGAKMVGTFGLDKVYDLRGSK